SRVALRAVVERLGHVLLPHLGSAGEVGDGPGHAKHAIEAPSAELQALARARQEAPRPAGRSSERKHLPPRRGGVQRAAPSDLPLTRGFHPAPYGRRRLLFAAGEEAVEALPGYGHEQVDAIADRTAQPASVLRHAVRLATAAPLIAEVAARARVGRAHEHEVGGEADGCAQSSNGDDPLLERLPQRLEVLTREL